MIWGNFVLAVWLSIAYAAWEFGWIMRHAGSVNEAYGPFSARVVMFPLVLGGAQLFLWWRVYRARDRFARGMAGFAAAFFALQVVIGLLQRSVELTVPPWQVLFFGYLALSHAFFALHRAE